MSEDRQHLRSLVEQIAALGKFTEFSDSRFYEVAYPLLDRATDMAGAAYVDADRRTVEQRILDTLDLWNLATKEGS